MEKRKIVHGIKNCFWWDFKENAAIDDNGIPVCPRCGSVLFEHDYDNWIKELRDHDRKNPGYFDFMTWMRGWCFPTMELAVSAYNHLKGDVRPCPYDYERCFIKIDCEYCSRNNTRSDIEEILITSEEKVLIELVCQGYLKRLKKEAGGGKVSPGEAHIYDPEIYRSVEVCIKDGFFEYLKTIEKEGGKGGAV